MIKCVWGDEYKMTKLKIAKEALELKDGNTSLKLSDEILAEDESCYEAWIIALKSFELILSIEQYKAQDDLQCAKYAVSFAPKECKNQVRKEVYLYLLNKINSVINKLADILANGTSIMGFYQKTAYFNAASAAKLTMEEDSQLIQSVKNAFSYCMDVFEGIPVSVFRTRVFKEKCLLIANSHRKAMNYLLMRYQLYSRPFTLDEQQKALKDYAGYLKFVPTGKEILLSSIPYNISNLDPLVYWEEKHD